jgi:hypothetical protein
VGALIGGAIFRLFGIWPALDSVAISLRHLLAAFIGSLLFLLLVWMVRNRPWGSLVSCITGRSPSSSPLGNADPPCV